MPGTGEREEDIIDPSRKSAIQYSFAPPSLAELILNPQVKNEFTFGKTIVPEKPEPGTRIEVSDLELIVPWLLAKEEDRPFKRPEYGDSGIEASVIGTRLHETEVLFTVVVGRLEPKHVKKILPTYAQQEREPYERAISGVRIGARASQVELEAAFVAVWQRYHKERNFDINRNKVLLSGLGFKDPHVVEDIVYSPEMYEIGTKLAHAWAEQVERQGHWRSKKDLEAGIWEFQKNTTTQREVGITVNFTNKLQIQTKLDSITRRNGRHDLVTVQVLDLKTGDPTHAPAEVAEVQKRQAQLMLIIAEHFTAEFFNVNRSLAPRKAFIFKADHLDSGPNGRASFGYEFFDVKSGNMTFAKETMSPEERSDFTNWFTWLGKSVQAHKGELKPFLGRSSK